MQENTSNNNIIRKVIIAALSVAAIVIFAVNLIVILSTPNVDMTLPSDDLTYVDEEESYMTPTGYSVPKGIYEVTIRYTAESWINTKVRGVTNVHNGVISDDPRLKPDYNVQSFCIWINSECSDLRVGIEDTGYNYEIEQISVKTAWNSKLYGIAKLVFAYMFAAAVILFICFRKRLSKYSFEIISLASIAFVCSVGYFARYLIPGHDYIFHMMRIEGIKDAILLGDIPCKVQANWCYDWGYAVSAAYGDVTLIFPAILRLLGFTIQTSYKAFVILVNIVTVLVCYFCFRQMCKDSRIVIFMTMLYSLAPYRLALLYYREATGEYTGMIFLPMIMLGFYHAYMDDVNDSEYGKKLLVPVLGFSLLIQTHLVTCVMTGMAVAVVCLVNWKKTFTPKTFIYLAKIALFTILVTLWFLLPMFVFLHEPLEVSSVKNYWAERQNYALSLTEIFAQRASGTTKYNQYRITSLSDRFTTSLGNSYVLMVLVYVYLLWKDKIKENKKAACLLMILGTVFVFMSSNLFPYSAIWKFNQSLAEFFLIIQYPYRYLTMSILLFTLMVPFIYRQVSMNLSAKVFTVIVCMMVVLTVDQAADMIYKAMYNGECVTCYDIVSLDTNAISGREYIYYGTDPGVPYHDHDLYSENVHLDSYSRLENRFDITVSNSGADASVSLPLYYYPGYTAWDDNGELLMVDRGDNNRIKITVPEGYSGGIKLRYRERKLWRLCEVISAIGFLGLLFVEFDGVNRIRNRQGKYERK